jgi:hypothetical protein
LLLGACALSTLAFGLVGCADDCEDRGCPPTVAVLLPDFSEREGSALLLVACNEQVCAELDWNPACTEADTERFHAAWCLSSEGQTQLSIEPHFAVADGDEYRISIQNGAGELVFEESFVAVYTRATPSNACQSCTTAKADFTN